MGNSAASNSEAARPSRFTVAPTYSPLALVTFSRAATATPAFFAKASAAVVGAPSLKATFHEGPVSCSSLSAWLGQHALDQHGQTARRRVSGQLGPGGKQPLAREQIVDPAAQLGLGPGNHAGGNLVQPNLQ